MDDQTEWVILDTETDGLEYPIHVLEVAAQRMRGKLKDGAPFRVFLNHNIRVPPTATAIHGYTKEFLDKNGIAPAAAYEQLRSYVGNRQVVAHYLRYDWNAVLLPEWRRLRLLQIGQSGFCTWRLSKRVVFECGSHRLDLLRDKFGFPTDGAHTAIGDVEAVYLLLSQVVFPRLERVGITSFSDFAQFCEEPVFKCQCLLQGKDHVEEARKLREARKEREARRKLLEECIATPEPALWVSRGLLTEAPEIVFQGKKFQFTGKMIWGSRSNVTRLIESLAGIVADTKTCTGVDFLVLGEDLEKGWTRLANGGKIADGIHRKAADAGCVLSIVLESDFIDALMKAIQEKDSLEHVSLEAPIESSHVAVAQTQ